MSDIRTEKKPEIDRGKNRSSWGEVGCKEEEEVGN